MPLLAVNGTARAASQPLANGGAEVCEATVRRYLPLVRDVAHTIARRKPPNVEFEELMSWGMEGLLDAYERYRPDKHASFGTYARFRVRGAILDNLREQDRLSRTARRRVTLLDRTRERLEALLFRQPAEDEIARALQIDLAELRTMEVEADYRVLSIEEMATVHDGQGDVEQHMPDHESDPFLAVVAKEHARLLVSALRRLPEKEHVAVALYYASDLTMREVGTVLGLTESRVSQLHSQALSRLRRLLQPFFATEREPAIGCGHTAQSAG